jgi:DNA processing protein
MRDRTDDAEDFSALALGCMAGMTREHLEALARRFGTLGAAEEAGVADLAGVGLPPELAESVARGDGRRESARILEACKRLEVKCLLPHHRDWPAGVERVTPRPTVLYLRGRIRSESVAVVGSRHPDAYGLRFARELGHGLASSGVCVVSGAALGIDGAAHRGALDAAVSYATVAVLGCGIDVVYPPRHRDLLAAIALGGALLSELPPGGPPLKPNFPKRNRLIAALASAVVVVQAAERSGSLITAGWARRLGIPLLATPGPAGDALSAGTNQLLRSGAAICASLEDVLLFLRRPAVAHPPKVTRMSITDLDPGSACLLGLLSSCPVSLDDLSVETGMASERTAALMTRLELMGLAERSGVTFVRAA